MEENVPIGFEITRIFAVDEDNSMNGLISYTLEGEEGANETFHIDEETGIITTINKLDREEKEKYILKVMSNLMKKFEYFENQKEEEVTATFAIKFSINYLRNGKKLFIT